MVIAQVSGARFVWMGTEAAGRVPWAMAMRAASAFKPMGTRKERELYGLGQVNEYMGFSILAQFVTLVPQSSRAR
jgi:hypothetical protein